MLDRREELEENEYSFEAGVNEAVRRIHELLKRQDIVVVSVGGAAEGDTRDVGKTYVSNTILQKLYSAGIPFVGMGHALQLDVYSVRQLKEEMEIRGTKKAVIMLHAQGTTIDSTDTVILKRRKSIHDEFLLSISTQAGLPLEKIDLRILVYRPDRPVSENEKRSVDLRIRNDFAKNKPGSGYV